jgi:hypothetical protein
MIYLKGMVNYNRIIYWFIRVFGGMAENTGRLSTETKRVYLSMGYFVMMICLRRKLRFTKF